MAIWDMASWDVAIWDVAIWDIWEVAHFMSRLIHLLQLYR